MPNEKTCSRPGCDKVLQARNQSGACTSGCRSSEAPAGIRAATGAADSERSTLGGGQGDVLKRFKVVARALGKDPERILREAAEEWLRLVAKAVE